MGGYVPALRVVEHFDDRVRKARELTQRANDAFPKQAGRLIEAYVSGEIKLGLRCALEQSAEYGFTLSAIRVANGLGFKVPRITNPQGDGKDVDGEQPLMLADNVEVMEVVQEFVPSFVRVERFYDLSFLGGEGLYEFVPLVVPARELGGAVSDRKVSIVNKRWAVAAGECGRQDVKAASNGVKVGPSFDVESERKLLFLKRNDVIVRNVRWQLFDTHINVSFDPIIEPRLKGWEMGYGPVDRRLSV